MKSPQPSKRDRREQKKQAIKGRLQDNAEKASKETFSHFLSAPLLSSQPPADSISLKRCGSCRIAEVSAGIVAKITLQNERACVECPVELAEKLVNVAEMAKTRLEPPLALRTRFFLFKRDADDFLAAEFWTEKGEI